MYADMKSLSAEEIAELQRLHAALAGSCDESPWLAKVEPDLGDWRSLVSADGYSVCSTEGHVFAAAIENAAWMPRRRSANTARAKTAATGR